MQGSSRGRSVFANVFACSCRARSEEPRGFVQSKAVDRDLYEDNFFELSQCSSTLKYHRAKLPSAGVAAGIAAVLD